MPANKNQRKAAQRLKAKRNRVKKAPKSEAEKYTDNIRKIFTQSGFFNIKSDGVLIEFMGRQSDIDNIFVYDNIIVMCEETVLQGESVVSHLSKKNLLYSLI